MKKFLRFTGACLGVAYIGAFAFSIGGTIWYQLNDQWDRAAFEMSSAVICWLVIDHARKNASAPSTEP